MPITGINSEKCVQCGICVQTCTQKCFTKNPQDGKIIFNDINKWCFACGHCIASCPEDAIVYENMGGAATEAQGIENPSQFLPFDRIQPFLRSIRSTRIYKTEPVPEQILQNIFDTMRYAPSGSNMRTWEFKLLSDPGLITDLSNQIQAALIQNPGLSQKYGQKLKIRKEMGVKDPIFFEAPHVLFVYSSLLMDMEAINTGIIVTYANIAAQSLGIGTCWIGLAQLMIEENTAIKKTLKIHGKCYGVVTLGYPKIAYKRLPPRPGLKIKSIKPKGS